jgi:hypothetical protein
MRFTLALAALVAATSALPSALQSVSKHALTTREDFVEDDFEIPAEADDPAKRSVGWPEVSPSIRTKNSDSYTHASVLFCFTSLPVQTSSHLASGRLTPLFFSHGTG